MIGWHVYHKDQPAHWYSKTGLSWCKRWRGSGTQSRAPDFVCEDCADPWHKIKFGWARLKQKARWLRSKLRDKRE